MRLNNKIIIDALSHRLKEIFSDNLIDVILFGSHINGTANDDSDYDILVILKQKTDWKTEREISDICFEIDLKYNIITDTHIISEPELSMLRGKQPIFLNAILNGLHA
jgi:uncharacterized protein